MIAAVRQHPAFITVGGIGGIPPRFIIHTHTQTAGVNSTEPPSSGAGNVHKPMLMSQVRRVRAYQRVRS
jgi:hypothetical protein